MNIARTTALLTLAIGAWTASSSAQTTWYVDAAAAPPGSGTATAPYASLQYAISRPGTLAGDRILVLPGVYTEHVDFLGKDLEVSSVAGAASTILDGAYGATVVVFQSGEGPTARLDGFTIRRGRGSIVLPGGGLRITGSSPTLVNLVVEQCMAERGGGLFLSNSSTTIDNSIVRSNRGLPSGFLPGWGAGIFVEPGSAGPTVTNCVIESNETHTEGGGVHGPGTYANCTIQGNTAHHGGGAFATGTLRLSNCVLRDNHAVDTFHGDLGIGGGVHGPATLTDCVLDHNGFAYQGGGAFGADLVRCQITNNFIDTAGGDFVRGGGASQCTLTDCTVDSNVCNGYSLDYGAAGGGLYACTATRTVVRGNIVRVSNSFVPVPFGGGGAAESVLTDCDLHDNQVILVDSGGSMSTFANGGGTRGGSATLCRIFHNSAPHGGGAADATLVNCTVFDNQGLIGAGGVCAMTAPTTLRNCIAWGDAGGETAAIGSTLAATYSDIQGGFAGTGNIAVDPRFVDASMHDFNLQIGSPCINSGDPASPLDPDGSRVDMGARPFSCPATAYCTGKVNSQGCTPAIGSTGTTSLSGHDDFVVTGRGFINQANGLLFWGRAAASVPFQGGTLCVQSPLHRTLIQNSGGHALPPDCSGTYAYAFTHAYATLFGLHAGDTIFAQWYSRDPSHTDGTGVGLSNAIRFTLCP